MEETRKFIRVEKIRISTHRKRWWKKVGKRERERKGRRRRKEGGEKREKKEKKGGKRKERKNLREQKFKQTSQSVKRREEFFFWERLRAICTFFFVCFLFASLLRFFSCTSYSLYFFRTLRTHSIFSHTSYS